MSYSKQLENHLKSLEINQNLLNYFKDNIFNICFGHYNIFFQKIKKSNFFFIKYNDESLETSKL